MRRAIIVDDEPIIRTDLAELLGEAGFDVVGQGGDGFDAVELCRRHRPDVALIDIKMPLFDGLGAAEKIIREELAGCVVLLTAFHDRDFIEKAKAIGVGGYLVKPVEERTILPTLEIALAQSSRFSRAADELREMQRQMEEKTLIERAKAIVAKREEISEGDAYALMRKMSMDKRCGIGEIASMIVSGSSPREAADKAKALLMRELGIDEKTAFRKLKEASVEKNCSLEQTALRIVQAYGEKPTGRKGS